MIVHPPIALLLQILSKRCVHSNISSLSILPTSFSLYKPATWTQPYHVPFPPSSRRTSCHPSAGGVDRPLRRVGHQHDNFSFPPARKAAALAVFVLAVKNPRCANRFAYRLSTRSKRASLGFCRRCLPLVLHPDSTSPSSWVLVGRGVVTQARRAATCSDVQESPHGVDNASQVWSEFRPHPPLPIS